MSHTMAMLPNDHHPGPGCSCGDCLRRWPEPEVCGTCNGRRFVSRHIEGREDAPAFDADDQPCPDCNPKGEGTPP